jgi:hypothetical protein
MVTKVRDEEDSSASAQVVDGGHGDRRADGTPGHPRAAADRANRSNSTEVRLPFVGVVRLPAPEELAFLGGVGVLAVVGAVEWPIAVVLGTGHVLATNRRNRVVQEFGDALEEA